MAVDDWFDPRSTGRALSGRGGGGGSSGSSDFDDYIAKHPELLPDEERGGGPRAADLPKRGLATYAHGYSYSEGAYPGGVPRYFDGHEALPANLPPHNIAALQRLMVDAGILDNPRFGFWDDESQAAYKWALSQANQQGTDVQNVLSTYAEANAIGEQEAKGPFVAPPLIYETTNKQDLHKVFRSAVIEQLGQGWTQEQVAELVDAYNWKEIQIQQQNQLAEHAVMRAEWEGTEMPDQINVQSMPAPETFIEDEIRRRDPEGYQENQGLGLLQGVLGESWFNPTSSPGTMFGG